ncbi:MAG: M14 family zinc carboxypeptidase [Alphaproteobacteria bacterium]
MRSVKIILVLIVLLTAATAFAEPVKTVANVYVPNIATFRYLQSFDVSFEEYDRITGMARVLGFRDTIQEIIDAGFEVEILIDDLAAWVAARNRHLMAQPPEAAPSEVVLDHYLTHAEVTTFLNDLATAHPDIMSVETIGYSVQGRELYLVKLSDNVDTNEDEPAIFFEFNIHGDEIAAYIMMLYTIERYVTEYGTDPTITDLVDTREIFIEPLTNPDGNQADSQYYRSRYNANGVDMNRNWGFMWSPYEMSPGSGPRSEPEVQAVASVLARSQPYMVGMAGHSGTVVFLSAWGYHGDVPLDWDEMDYIGEEYIYPNYCQDPYMDEFYQTSHGLYQCFGTSTDEMYGSHGMIGLIAEVTYDKQCSWAESYGVAQDHQPALDWLFAEIGQGLHGTVTDVSTSDPLAAVIEVDGKWYTFSDYEVGDYHKYLRPGTYDIRVYANGYQEYTNTITIVADTPYNLLVQLTADPEPTSFAFRVITAKSPNDEDTHTLAIDALGRPDGDFISLGYDGWIVLDLGPDGIDDGTGDDIAVYEGHGDGDESFDLYGSDEWNGPWTLIGSGAGNSDFDLNDVGLDNVRYVKIVDNDKGDPVDAGQYDGYDLDAVGTPIFMCSFGANPVSGTRPLTVNFTDNSTGDVTGWDWDFGDGGSSTAQNPSHEYTTNGLFTVSLTVTGPGGTDTLVKEDFIEVYEAAPVAEFSGDPITGPAPLDVQFTDETVGVVNTWYWQFGDGGTSMESDPLHTYNAVGLKTVRLTVNGPGGSDTKTRWFYINVLPPADDDTIDDDTIDDDIIDDDIVDDDIVDDDIIDDDLDDDIVDDDINDDIDDDIVDDDFIPDDDMDDDTLDDDVDTDDDDDDDGCGCS